MTGKSNFISKSSKKVGSSKLSSKPKRKTFYCAGSGGEAGTGPAYAYRYDKRGREAVKWLGRASWHEAEYLGLARILEYVATGSHLKIYSDSQLMVRQFNGNYAVRDPRLQKLLQKVKNLIEERGLEVELGWIQSEKNPASALLDAAYEDRSGQLRFKF